MKCGLLTNTVFRFRWYRSCWKTWSREFWITLFS